MALVPASRTAFQIGIASSRGVDKVVLIRQTPRQFTDVSFDARESQEAERDGEPRVPPNDRARLEQLCRYLLRPPLAQDRVRLRPDGRVLVELQDGVA